jgi:prepilin peptidase CpaA
MDDFTRLILQGAFGLFCLLVAAAALFDLWKLIIPNTVSVALVILFFATVLVLGFPVDWLSHLGAGAAVLLAGMAAFHFGVLGAGDAKLLAAVSLWAGFEYLLIYLLVVALCGGGLVVLLWLLRRIVSGVLLYQNAPEDIVLPPVLLPQGVVPYGGAIALGAIYLAFKSPLLGGGLF